MLNLVHTFGATKKEFRAKGESFAPSALWAGTTEGTCAETPCISVYYNHNPKKYHLFTKQPLKAPQTLGFGGEDRSFSLFVAHGLGGGGGLRA
jgi:hypothetical protein